MLVVTQAASALSRVLDRIGAFIVTRENGRFVGMQLKRLLMGDFLFGAVEAGNRRCGCGYRPARCCCAELALPQIGFLLDGIHRPLQRLHMDAIDIPSFVSAGFCLLVV